MAKLLVYYAHPGQQYSHVNRAMVEKARAVGDITFVDLYAEYPRFNIDIDVEQQRLLTHDIILFQFPLFWYSTPALIKEGLDLVLEFGFAYGNGGEKLKGKRLMLAVTCAGSEEAFSREGYQNRPIRTFLSPLEQTACLCQMQFTPPYVLYSSLHAPQDGTAELHASGYQTLLKALRDDEYDFEAAAENEVITFDSLPIKGGQ